MDIQKIIDEYSKEYCQELETAYGKGMMSEGGEKGIELMFDGKNLSKKNILDIGFGLGGGAFYLANKYQAKVSGIEINPYLVNKAKRNTPDHLQDLIDFRLYQEKIPFADNKFDFIYSKGVLCHLQNKSKLFQEIFRVLKKSGELIIVDWLSPQKNRWSKEIEKMCELENLSIFAETIDGYNSALSNAGFQKINMGDENKNYSYYNRKIAKSLEQKPNKENLKDAIKGYDLIADAIEKNDLLIRLITAVK